ncbi:Acetyltransferase (GNAT) family protein [Stieleria bergensis]|uniref:Acetyltransferase (GNAT) family protein n=1 Tax=Stieleria bergensis TaxID=2528025 RepID=A0A517SZ62_9BACT|nr:Acetyltransferase (GNAT) family protein [Planctomycetes bacterium SV_7m_r]
MSASLSPFFDRQRRSATASSKAKANITIRPAEANFADGLDYARFFNQASVGFIRFMLGRRFAEIIAEAFAMPSHDYSFENVLVAHRDGVVVGTAAGYTAEQHAQCSDEVLAKSGGYPKARMLVMKLAFASLWRLLNTIETGDFYLQSIAVTCECQGEGIGSMLVDAMGDRAKQTNSTRMVLDVAEKNFGARQLYERHGMRIESKWPRRLPIPRFGILRMAKQLG